ncbi:hypothetical protein [Robbsia sp. KACC 23696]|uniref:hypothetical protein n=1 Tax=Robbsia sp. KACC 23696 TaxID=3149231 RepID=UPI00325BAE82
MSLSIMGVYVHGRLSGEFSHHLMQAKRWGMPPLLQEKGLTPLYLPGTEAGWDGQFYYDAANDLLDLHGTSRFIDSDAYRYQRIGLPLFAKGLASVLGQSWVSPELYYAADLLLILLATFVGARFFQSAGVSPFWILLWTFGPGTQLTLLNGLPDAFADAWVILGMVAFVRGRNLLYAISLAMAALSRETFVVLPLALGAGVLLRGVVPSLNASRQRMPIPELVRAAFWQAIPVLVFAVWQIFIRLHFHKAPSSQAAGILGPPFESLVHHLSAGLAGHYPSVSEGKWSRIAGVDLVFFVVLLLAMAAVFIAQVRAVCSRQQLIQRFPGLFEVSAVSFVIVMLYMSFGDSVIWNFSGFMKAATIFVFLIPFLMTWRKQRIPAVLLVFLLVMDAYFGWRLWAFRLSGAPIVYKVDRQCAALSFDEQPTCRKDFVWQGRELPGIVGKVTGTARVATPASRADFLSYGPYIALPPGRYRVTLRYRRSADASAAASVVPPAQAKDFDWRMGVFGGSARVTLAHGRLLALAQRMTTDITVPTRTEGVELQVYYDGIGQLALDSIEIAQAVSDTSH